MSVCSTAAAFGALFILGILSGVVGEVFVDLFSVVPILDDVRAIKTVDEFGDFVQLIHTIHFLRRVVRLHYYYY